MQTADVMYSYVLCLLSIVIIIYIAYLQTKIKKTNVRQWCMLIVTCALIANISDMFQIINISNLNTLIFYQAFAYIGQAMLPICIFFAIAYYIDPNFKFKKRYLCLFYIPIITILCMFTNNYHGLMFKTYSTNFNQCQYGYMYYVYIANVYITYVLAFGMLIRYLCKIKSWGTILTSAICFFVPFLIYILGFLRIVDCKVYITEVVQSIMTIVLIYTVFKYEILKELPVSLNAILNTISDSFVVINDNKEIIMYNKVFLDTFNLGCLNIKKMNIDELIEFKEFDTIYSNDIDNIINLSQKKNPKKISFERDSITLDKTLKYDAEIIKENRKENLYLIFITETTEYSRNIKLLELNHEVMIGRERLASLGQMIGGIAHNLKTPIFSIAGGIEGLNDLVDEYRESIDDDSVLVEDHKEIASEMLNWTEKIKGYLTYMADIVKAIQEQTTNNVETIDEKFSIGELIKYIDILMKYELKKNVVDLRKNIQVSEEKLITGNVNTLVQVLNNLISNAIQAYSDEMNKIVELNFYEKEENLYIEVKDYACGIPKEIQNKLFKEMITTKGKNGTGLGLFISYTNIKTGFNGNLTFSTKEGKGTIFRIIIPEK